jgi:hypothetical protein
MPNRLLHQRRITGAYTSDIFSGQLDACYTLPEGSAIPASPISGVVGLRTPVEVAWIAASGVIAMM